jgi:ribosomal protein L28
MPKVCSLCGRGSKSSTNVSHSNRKTKRVVKANIQSKVLAGVKSNICTKCIKTKNKSAK